MHTDTKHVKFANNLVSVITPTYNSQDFILQTIKSVQAQTYTNWEMIIVDDASNDNTSQIVKSEMLSDKRIKHYQLDVNSGPAIARNKAIKEAKGDYIAFLDADDLWKENKLERQINFMKTNNTTICYSAYSLINESGETMNRTVTVPEKVTYKKMLRSNYIGNLTGIYNSKKLGKIYMPDIRKRQDWGLWLVCTKKEGVSYGINESLAFYRIRKNSVSSNKMELLKHNYIFYRKACGFAPLKAFFFLLLFLFEFFFVKSKNIVKTTS